MEYIYLVEEVDYEGAAWGASRVVAAFTKESDAYKYAACADIYHVTTAYLNQKEKHWVRTKFIPEKGSWYQRAKSFIGADDDIKE